MRISHLLECGEMPHTRAFDYVRCDLSKRNGLNKALEQSLEPPLQVPVLSARLFSACLHARTSASVTWRHRRRSR
jgi:hypothetical protein